MILQENSCNSLNHVLYCNKDKNILQMLQCLCRISQIWLQMMLFSVLKLLLMILNGQLLSGACQ